MSTGPNAVKIAPRPTHHFGGLRAALLAEGLRLLGESGSDALSLREVARNVGVSATAVYHHFPDKSALLSALAAEGMRRLAERQVRAGAAGGEAGFAETGREYVRFAIENPGLFRLMFAHAPMRLRADAPGPAGSPERLLRDYVAGLLGPASTQRERFALALRAWSLVHGLAMLVLDGQIAADAAGPLIEDVVNPEGLLIVRRKR